MIVFKTGNFSLTYYVRLDPTLIETKVARLSKNKQVSRQANKQKKKQNKLGWSVTFEFQINHTF